MSATKFKADRVILVGHVEDGDEDKKRLERLRSKLEEKAIEVETTECNIFDLYHSLGLIAELITEFEDDDVYVNVSTGSKVTAIAGMIACMAIDATAYYAKAKKYTGDYPEELESVQELPRYPIDAPESQQVEMLYVISEMKKMEVVATKGKLIHVGEHLGMPFITENEVKDKGKYRALDKEILDPLVEQGYVTISREGRNKVVEITQEGENTLRAFGYLIDESQEELFEKVKDQL